MSVVEVLTPEEFKAALPARVGKNVTKQVMNQINQVLSDPDLYETYRENLLSYGKIMQEGRFKLSSYIDAVKYVSHKLMGKTNIEAYSITFPDKIQRFQRRNYSAKDISSYVSAYNKSKLVNLIMEQSLVPSWVLNQDMYQQALNTQAELMLNANSEKVRSDAANSLLTHLKPPELQKVELNVRHSEDSSIAQLRQATLALAAKQREALMAGAVNATEVAHSTIVIEGEVEND